MSRATDHFSYKNGVLSSEGISIAQVAQKYGTPVYIYSSEAFLKPVRELKEGLRGLDSLICFAMKSNSNLDLLKLLSNQGLGVDVVTGGELFRAQQANIPAERVVFSGVGKTEEEMTLALNYLNSKEQGIFSFNVESLPELYTLNRVASRLNKKARVALRFNPDVNPKTHPYISTGLKKNKFGLEKKEILQALNEAASLSSISIQGMSIHIGSQLLSLSPIEDAFSKLKLLLKEANKRLKDPISYVDLGGGTGITYKNEKSPSLNQYCNLIRKYFGEATQTEPPLKVLIEPGRAISGNAGILVTQILYRKQRGSKDFLIIDAGMNDLIRPALYESYHEIVPILRPKSTLSKKKYDIVGPVCESSDCFASNRLLPKQLKEGDLLAILSAGAYGFSMASNYNSRPRPPEVMIEEGQFRLIRKRETYEDLIRGEPST